MMRYVMACAFLSLLPVSALAEGAAPDLFGVREVVVDYVKFDDPKASETCGLSREQISADLARVFTGSGVPAIPIMEAKPPSMGIARIQLIPEISTHSDENLNCVSWISLSAESRANTIISPVTTLRSITALYWRQHTVAATNQSAHTRIVDDVMQKMAVQFAQQFKLDQPPDLPK